MQTIEKNTPAGYLARVELSDTTVLNIFTKAWNYRGWKIYDTDKTFIILSGTAEVTLCEWWQDTTNTYSPHDWPITIASSIPNIFYFPEDCEMIEWFSKDVRTEKYERYVEMKRY